MSSIEDDSIDCIWTDPPYFLSNDGITCVAGKMVTVNKGEWDRSNGLENDHEFNRTWLAECHRILKPAGTIWVTGTVHVYLSVGMAMLQLGFRILNDIVWEKPNPPPNLGRRCFTHSTETILWATKAKKGSRHRHTFNYDIMREEKWRPSNEDGLDDLTCWSRRKETRKTSHPETSVTHRALHKGIDQCWRYSLRSFRRIGGNRSRGPRTWT